MNEIQENALNCLWIGVEKEIYLTYEKIEKRYQIVEVYFKYINSKKQLKNNCFMIH